MFVIKKRNGKWRLLYDLRKMNEVMEDMGALRPGLPSPTMLPHSWTLIVIDLKDCLLNPCQNSDNFAMFMFQLIPSLFFIFASVHAGEKAKGVCKHLLSAFAKLGVPKMIKRDNGPRYGARATHYFFQQWGIQHLAGIPHSPYGSSNY